MKVTIRNVGIVKSGDIELKPLTIFIGPNNAGKSWVAYMLSGILGPFGWDKHKNSYLTGDVPEVYPSLDKVVNQVLGEGAANIDLIQLAEEYGEKYFNNVASFTRDWFREYMQIKRVSFENLEVFLSFAESKKLFIENVLASSFNARLGAKGEAALVRTLKEAGDKTLYYYTSAEEKATLEKLPIRAIKDHIIGNTFEIIHRAFCRNVAIFPTERTTLMPVLDFAVKEVSELSGSKKGYAGLKEESDEYGETRRIWSAPIYNFIRMVINASLTNLSDREEDAKKEPVIKKALELAQLLESKILGGVLDFSTTDADSRRELIFHPTTDIVLDMQSVSSMIKGCSPLMVYLRYRARPGDWLFMDEPEMNLHPEAQLSIIEFLAMLINTGFNIILTTHSPYIVDHLINLMKAAELEDMTSVKKLFYLKKTEAFIPKEKVSVYLFEKGTIKNILRKDGLIDWGTFGKVSDRVSWIYDQL